MDFFLPGHLSFASLVKALSSNTPSNAAFISSFCVQLEQWAYNVESRNLRAGYLFWRARKGLAEPPSFADEPDQLPWTGKDILAPDPQIASAGRFNLSGQPMLYGACSGVVALAEIQPNYDEECSLANLELTKDCRMAILNPGVGSDFDLFHYLGKPNPSEGEIKSLFYYCLADHVSKRPSSDTFEAHYLSCQLIASTLRDAGIDGILYRTSFWNPSWGHPVTFTDIETNNVFPSDDTNIVFFDPDVASFKRSAIATLKWQRPSADIEPNSYS